MKKLLALVLAMLMVLSLAACGAPDPTQPANNPTDPPATNDPTDPPKPSVEKYTDFGGYDFVISDWFTSAEPAVYNSSWQEFVADYQTNISSEYNFKYSRKNIALTGSYTELVPAKLMAGDKDVSMYYFFEGYVVPTVSQNLLWDLNELDSFDKNDPKWDKISMNTFTFDGKIYAVDPATREPLMGMFYNKRILEEAGVDPDLPYELQAKGEWTWAKLEELLALTTKDTNKDGLTDVWGIGSSYGNMSLFAAWSNGAAFIKRDENGKFLDGTSDPAFLESMEWLQKLAAQGWAYVYNSNGAGDTDPRQVFKEGKLAFFPYNFWISNETYLEDAKDDWGFVYLPYGPSTTHVTMNAQSYGYGIPKVFNKEEAEKIFQMFDLITDITYDGGHNDWTVEGADEYEDTYWTEEFGNSVRDARTMDETLYEMMFNEEKVTMDYVRMVPGFNYTNFTSDIVNLKKTPMEKIEEMRPGNQAALNSTNNLLGLN